MKEHHVAKFHELKMIKATVSTMYDAASNIFEALHVASNSQYTVRTLAV
jgi:hypothetical protein